MNTFECALCGVKQPLPESAEAFAEAKRLFNTIIEQQTIAIFGQGRQSMSLEALSKPGKGKMVGVLHYRNKEREGFLYGFSGQFDDDFKLFGFVPALIDYEVMGAHKRATERMLDQLGEAIEATKSADTRKDLKHKRKRLSQALMQDIFVLYRPMTGLGFKLRIEKAWGAKSGIPAATGDCCAPKLLQEANRLGYQVLGVAEIFVGSARQQSDQVHGHFATPCAAKCQPLLGAMLCNDPTCSQ